MGGLIWVLAFAPPQMRQQSPQRCKGRRTPRIRSTIGLMTSRQFRIGGLVLSAAFAALGILALAEARYGTATFWLVVSVAWMLLAFFRNNALRAQERRRQRLEA